MQRYTKGLTRLSKTYCIGAVFALILFTQVGSVSAAPGSWSRQVPSVMVAMSDRPSNSQPVAAPEGVQVANALIDRVNWRYEVPPHTPVQAWLCHPEKCAPLFGMRGSTMALAGLYADAPLYFRFALTPGQRPVRVQGLHVIVNYQ